MLELKNISVKYKNDEILHNINAEFKSGTVYIITGASGCGKSTLIRLINGVIPYSTSAEINGSIIKDGEEINELDIAERSNFVSTVFQNPKNQFYTINTTDEMAFALENRGTKPSEILKIIDEYSSLLGTKHLLDKNIFKLSGGEKQLVAITSVACLNQDIYIFDEPSSSLDAEAIEKLSEIIKKLKFLGKTVIIAEHRLYYLSGIYDKLMIIENGSLTSYEQSEITNEIIKKHNLRSLDRITEKELINKYFREQNLFSKENYKSALLNCENYKYAFKKGEDIFDFSISFDQNIYFIIGRNGIGKTTFIRCLCKLNKHFKGKTSFDGIKLKNSGKYISMVMQDVNYQLFTDSVLNEISIVSDDEPLKEQILSEIGLWEKRDEHPQSLSGGEKQRLAIALAMASSKPLVILDEPTSGLCKSNMKKTIAFIHKMKENGKTIIITTHDYEFIKECGGHIIKFC